MIPAARQPLLLAVTPLVLLMAVPLPAAKAVLPLVERWEALPARDKRWVVTTTMVAVAGETE